MNTQVALVTGGASGMGQIYALRMAQSDTKVAILDRDEQGRLYQSLILKIPLLFMCHNHQGRSDKKVGKKRYNYRYTDEQSEVKKVV